MTISSVNTCDVVSPPFFHILSHVPAPSLEWPNTYIVLQKSPENKQGTISKVAKLYYIQYITKSISAKQKKSI